MDNQYGDIGQSSGGTKSRYEDRFWYRELKHKDGDEFEEHFRISRGAFIFISDTVDRLWKKGKKNKIYHVDEYVAYSLWELANGATYEEVSAKFEVNEDTFRKHALKVYNIIDRNLKDAFLGWPDKYTKNRIKCAFEEAHGIPNIIGRLYTHHLEISQRDTRFLNSLKRDRLGRDVFTLPVQGVVDSQGKFLDVFCDAGVGGSKTDEEVLDESRIWEKIEDSDDFIVGGNTYPLRDWLMVPYNYSRPSETDPQWLFDAKLGEFQPIARVAFEELVGRWSYLGQRIREKDYEMIPVIVRVCCIIHNICKFRRDELAVGFTTTISNDPTPRSAREASRSSMEARDQIAHILHLNNGLLCVKLPRAVNLGG